jgi:hypothetical protein
VLTSVEGLSRVQVFPLVKQVVTRANCVVFFGTDLGTIHLPASQWSTKKVIASNQEFTEAALEFPQAVVTAAEMLRITPQCMKTYVKSREAFRAL